jgi:hypothetical protein
MNCIVMDCVGWNAWQSLNLFIQCGCSLGWPCAASSLCRYPYHFPAAAVHLCVQLVLQPHAEPALVGTVRC